MKKLSKRELWWIIRQRKLGKLSVYQIAKQREVTSRWIRSIWKFYLEKGEIPQQKPCGRKPISISEKEKELVINIWKDYPAGAVNLEVLLKLKHGINMPHNKIHRILRESNLSNEEPKKQGKRKWVRYERKHSNSLWHVDWSELKDGTKLIIYEDDASRFITGWGVFSSATLRDSLLVFRRAVRQHGAPKQLLSDNGTQFRFNEAFDRDLETKNRFQKVMNQQGVKQIFTKVHRPQANGKVERLFQSIKRYAKHFGTVKKAVEFYNYRRMHMSLKDGESPYEAFKRKMRK